MCTRAPYGYSFLPKLIKYTLLSVPHVNATVRESNFGYLDIKFHIPK